MYELSPIGVAFLLALSVINFFFILFFFNKKSIKSLINVFLLAEKINLLGFFFEIIN